MARQKRHAIAVDEVHAMNGDFDAASRYLVERVTMKLIAID